MVKAQSTNRKVKAMNREWQEFHLTTGEVISVPTDLGGESFEWLGQCSYEELGLQDVDDDSLNIRCVTTRGDDMARQVGMLYNSEANVPELTKADEDSGINPIEDIWAAFCEATDWADFQKRLDELETA
jgi:hypothetical protein